MTKKRKAPTIEEVLTRPWCYYCERDFDDLKILISHQKAKHFKCDHCNRRLNTAGGLGVHLQQVHKESLSSVANALPARADANVEIFGMEGIPEDIKQQHQQRVVSEFYQKEAEHRRATGNPPPGSGRVGNKHPKIERGIDIKTRLNDFLEGRQPEPTADDDAPTPDAANGTEPAPAPAPPLVTSADIDNLVAEGKGSADPQEATPTTAEPKASKSKKEKKTKLAYSSNNTSPEEKMASFSKFAFERPLDDDTVMGDAQGPLVTGVVRGQDTVIDSQGD